MAAAYSSVSQADHDAPYDNNETMSDPTNSPSPELPQFTHRPLSLAFENISGDVAVIDPSKQNDETASHGVGGLLKSFSSGQSYQMVEDDDYEELQPTPRKLEHTIPSTHEAVMSVQSPIRTASVSRHLPLKHPVPDLQSMQGAYTKNVERLEESAERLSMTSSIDEEIQKMKAEQRALERRTSGASSNGSARRGTAPRQFSSTSASNSIIGVNTAARNGGYSPSGYITSPTGSIRGGSWARSDMQRRASKSSRLGGQLPEPDYEGQPLDFGEEPAQPPPGVVGYNKGVLTVSNEPRDQDRPTTAASNNTQEGDPFADFDGEYHNHRPSLDRDGASMRRISLAHPPLARDSKAYKEAQPGEKMIYYPAPVPVMLNLPTRLSRANFGEREKRRLQALSGVPEEMRKSAAWLNNDSTTNLSERQLKLPPQLRASAFFEQPGISPNLQLQNGSAVHTLDSILDAAAHAPVSAFTDHPIAGRLGKEVYGTERQSRKSAQLDREIAKKAKRRSSLSNILKSKKSSDKLDGAKHGRITSRESKILGLENGESGDELEKATAASMAPGEDELVADGDEDSLEDDDASSESEHRPGFSEAPTTLLAELQMRKAQQKMRNRTAADAFPNGMHSTLLELDAVTQLQQKSRKTKHVTLAWEDHEAAERENFDDEDVPLGVLFPEKDRSTHQNINRPMGLMEKREMEDNEPLSFRRARLRGEPIQAPIQRAPSPVKSMREDVENKFKLDLPGNQVIEEQEDETLGQRLKRIKEEKERATAGNFASDMASQLGLEPEKLAPSKTPDAEETLGQRRKRLKEEAEKGGRVPSGDSAGQVAPGLKARRSMADILQTYPNGMRQVSGESANARPGQMQRFSTFGPSQSQTNLGGQGLPQIPAHMQANYNHAPYMQPQYNASQGMMYGYAGMPQMASAIGANGVAYGMMGDPMGPPLTAQQRSVIDRWREGIA